MAILSKLLGVLNPFLPHILSVIALITTFIWYSNAQYKAGEAAAQARFDALQNTAKVNQQELEAVLQTQMDETTNQTKEVLDGLGVRQTELRTTIIREIEKEPRLSDPEQGLSDGLLEAVNKARQETHGHD